MPIFSPDFVEFFKELARNNHKDWFQANKKRYETSVKQPFYQLVDTLIERISAFEPGLEGLTAKDCVLRINRDIRFSADKTPYNLHCTAFISAGGRKNKSIPGFFIRFGPEMIGIMGGCYGPDQKQLEQIRQAITRRTEAFRVVLQDSDFVEKYGQLQGETYKRPPKGYKEAAEEEPLLLNKQYYFMAKLPATHITGEELVETLMGYYQAARPVNIFLKEAIQN